MVGMVDLSRRPHHSPSRVDRSVQERVLALKKEYPEWGPRKLRRLWADRHPEPAPALSTVARILARHGLVTPREEPVTYPQVRHFEYAHPNELWQMDLKAPFYLGDGRRLYLVGLLDDHSRYLLGLWLLPKITDELVLACWIAAARQYGLPRCTLTDHGAQFGMEPQASSAFRVYLWACGVRHAQGRVSHPQTQGKIERLWETCKKELDPKLALAAVSQWPLLIEQWRHRYNTLRPHESLADETPVSRYRPSERPFVEPDRRACVGSPTSVYRCVNPRGRIFISGVRLMIGRGFAGWMVEVRPLGYGCWHVYFRNRFIREILLVPAQPQAGNPTPQPVTHLLEQVLPMS
jgi:transposase InsO family protein